MRGDHNIPSPTFASRDCQLSCVYLPLPLTVKVVGLLLALLLIWTVALSLPVLVGVKTTATMHLPPGATLTGFVELPHEVEP